MPSKVVRDDDQDDGLVDDFKRGDPQAFEALWHRHRRLVHRQIRLAGVVQPDAIDDISQDVFVRVYRFLGAFRGDASFRSWLIRLTINESRTHRVRTIARGKMWTDSSQGTPDSLLEGLREPTQFDQLLVQRQSIRRAMAALPPDLRRLAVLRYVRGMKYAAIAELLGCPRGTIESRLFRARRKLREILSNDQGTNQCVPPGGDVQHVSFRDGQSDSPSSDTIANSPG